MKYNLALVATSVGEKGQRTCEGTLTEGTGDNATTRKFVARDQVDSSYPDRFKVTACAGKRLGELDANGQLWSRGHRIAIAAFCAQQKYEKVEAPVVEEEAADLDLNEEEL